jgi:hypothetical protein
VMSICLTIGAASLTLATLQGAVILAWIVLGVAWTMSHRDPESTPLAARRRGARTGLVFGLAGIVCAVAVRLVL